MITDTQTQGYKKTDSFAKEKIQAQEFTKQAISYHIPKTENQVWADLMCMNPYLVNFGLKEYGKTTKFIIREDKISVYEEVKKSKILPDTGIDYQLGDILHLRGKKFNVFNGDYCSSFSKYRAQMDASLILNNQFAKKSLFITNHCKRCGEGEKFRNEEYPNMIVKELKRQGHNKIEFQMINYANINQADGSIKPLKMDMFLSFFFIG